MHVGREKCRVIHAFASEGLKPDIAGCTDEYLEGFIRAKYELGSFREGGDGRIPQASSARHYSNAHGIAYFVCNRRIEHLFKVYSWFVLHCFGASASRDGPEASPFVARMEQTATFPSNKEFFHFPSNKG